MTHQIELSAGTIEFEDTGGAGLAIVLLGGLMMDASLWEDVIAEPARRRRESEVRGHWQRSLRRRRRALTDSGTLARSSEPPRKSTRVSGGVPPSHSS